MLMISMLGNEKKSRSRVSPHSGGKSTKEKAASIVKEYKKSTPKANISGYGFMHQSPYQRKPRMLTDLTVSVLDRSKSRSISPINESCNKNTARPKSGVATKTPSTSKQPFYKTVVTSLNKQPYRDTSGKREISQRKSGHFNSYIRKLNFENSENGSVFKTFTTGVEKSVSPKPADFKRRTK